MLKLFYITKDPAVARIAQAAGVDRIFVDMEYIGKAQRQGGMDTVQNHHTVEDVARLRPVLDQAELLVRVNPVHPGSKEEIDRVIAAGADVIMLPMWQSVEEVYGGRGVRQDQSGGYPFRFRRIWSFGRRHIAGSIYCSGALPAGFVHEYSVSRLLQHGADYRFEGDQTDFHFRCGRATAV